VIEGFFVFTAWKGIAFTAVLLLLCLWIGRLKKRIAEGEIVLSKVRGFLAESRQEVLNQAHAIHRMETLAEEQAKRVLAAQDEATLYGEALDKANLRIMESYIPKTDAAAIEFLRAEASK
jgi:hypothetical protein